MLIPVLLQHPGAGGLFPRLWNGHALTSSHTHGNEITRRRELVNPVGTQQGKLGNYALQCTDGWVKSSTWTKRLQWKQRRPGCPGHGGTAEGLGPLFLQTPLPISPLFQQKLELLTVCLLLWAKDRGFLIISSCLCKCLDVTWPKLCWESTGKVLSSSLFQHRNTLDSLKRTPGSQAAFHLA